MPIKEENKHLYPSNWNYIRADILQRAKNKCEICQVDNGKYILRGERHGTEVFQDDDGAIWRTDNGNRYGDDYVGEVTSDPNKQFVKIVLTIAHLDHNPQNNCYSNLQALCQLHHLRHDIDHHRQSRRKTKLKRQPELFE